MITRDTICFLKKLRIEKKGTKLLPLVGEFYLIPLGRSIRARIIYINLPIEIDTFPKIQLYVELWKLLSLDWFPIYLTMEAI